MHETSLSATPYDVDLTPNGLIAVVRGNSSATSATIGSDQRVSFWRTDVTSSAAAKIIPNVVNTVGRGNLTTSSGIATFSNAIAASNERAVLIGGADTTFDLIEDTTYVDIVSFDYTQSPPTATVLSTTVLGGGTSAGTMAGLAHDVAITPDGLLAVVSHRNWIHVFEMLTGTQVAAFNVGGTGSPSGAGPCSPGLSRNSLEVTNDHAVVTMSRVNTSFPTSSETWVYVLDLSYSPPGTLPTLVLEHEPFSAEIFERKPHDLAISPDGTLAGISSYNTFALYDLSAATPAFVGGNFNFQRWKEALGCGAIWDSIEMSNQKAVVLSDLAQQEPSAPCEWEYWWTAQVFSISSTSVFLEATFNDKDLFPTEPPEYPGNETWDVAMSDDGTLAAIKNNQSDVVLVNVHTTPSLVRLGSTANLGAPAAVWSGYPWLNKPGARANDTVAVPRGYVTHALPPDPPTQHRWLTFLGQRLGQFGAPDWSNVVQYDLPKYLASTPQWQEFIHTDASNSTWTIDLELNASQREVLVRDTAPPDEANPAAGGRDWYRYDAQTTPPTQLGITLGGKGLCVGVDNLIQRRGVAVSISAGSVSNSGFVHVVRTY